MGEREKVAVGSLSEQELTGFAFIAERDRKHLEEMQYSDTKASQFWERKRNNTQNLRNKAQQ